MIAHFKHLPETPLETCYTYKIPMLILFCILLIPNSFADSPCGRFVMKVTYLTQSDRQDSGYIYFDRYRDGILFFNYIDEYYTINNRIALHQIDFGKISGFDTTNYSKIIAVNRSVMRDTSISIEYNGYIDIVKMPITDSIRAFSYIDTVNYSYYSINAENEASYALDSLIDYQSHTIHYGIAEYLNLDTIKLIVMDTILWCGDADQLQFLKNTQIRKLEHENPIAFFRITDSNAQQWWLDFFCFDHDWSKSRILSSLDLVSIDNIQIDGAEIFNDFPPELQRAIKANKVLYFLRWSP